MKHYRIIYNFILISFLFGSCSSDSWDNQEKNEFMHSCIQEGVEKEKCDCMMNETMKRYPRYDESKEISFEEAVEIAEICD